MDAVLLLLRWAHILGAVLTAGGLFFGRFAVLPAVADTDEATREKLHEALRRRWLPWVIGGITLLLVSGVANFLLFNAATKGPAWSANGDWMRQHNYHLIFGIKFLLALGVFYLASGLVGRGGGTAWIRRDRGLWMSVALGLAVAVIMLSGWLRNLHTGPNPGAEPEGVAVESPVDPAAAPAAEDRYRDSEAGAAFREPEAAKPPSPATD